VLHVIPGPVDAATFLREARWAVDAYESAQLEHADDPDGQRQYLKLAHARRYPSHNGKSPEAVVAKLAGQADRIDAAMPRSLPRGNDRLAQAHWLLWANPMPTLSGIYRTVWTDILKEQVTDAPVRAR